MQKTIKCDVCPRGCLVKEGNRGKCGIFHNTHGHMINLYHGHCSNVSVEPIEKRPLFHFLPGSQFLSVGFYGCSLNCKYCQNFWVSQEFSDGCGEYYSPAELVDLAELTHASGIAFTYNEPTLYYSYIKEVKQEIDRISSPLKIVLKSNGFVNDHILSDLCSCVDGFNIDLKGNDKDYSAICEGSLDKVLSSIELVSRSGVHLEISYLVLPDRIHDVEFNSGICDWVVSLGRDIPVHLLYFYPFHKMSGNAAYSAEDLVRLYDMFSCKLNYVYISNRYDNLISYRNTKCSICGKTIIIRNSSTDIVQKTCCHNSIPGVFA